MVARMQGVAVLTCGTAAADLAGTLEGTCATIDRQQPPSLVLVTLQKCTLVRVLARLFIRLIY